MKKTLLLLSMAFLLQAPVWSATDAETMNWLKLGDDVECDISMSQKSDGAKWRIGKVYEINKKGNFYIVSLPDNSKLKIVNNSKWIKPASEAVTQSFTEPAEIKSPESQRKESKPESNNKPGEIAAPIEPGKSFKEKKGGALSRSAYLFRLAFRR